jgi:hypothetical protein
MNNISANFTPSLFVRGANFLKFNPYARNTALIIANIGILFLAGSSVGLEFIEEKINTKKSTDDKPFSFSIPQAYFIASAVALVSTLAIKSFFNLPLSYVAAGALSLGSVTVVIVGLEKPWK